MHDSQLDPWGGLGGGPLSDAELDLLEMLFHDYGYDYRTVGAGWLRSKLVERVAGEQLQTLRGLREKVLHDEGCRHRLLRSLAVDANTMFHDAAFYRAFRAEVVPLLRTYPFARLWHVGCSSGEEVYSLAMLLEEEGLYERCRVYATDEDEAAIRRAQEGVFPLTVVQSYNANYVRAGGQADLSDYYSATEDTARIRGSLKRNLIFSHYHLGTDGPFNEFHAIVWRGGLPGLDPAVRARAHELLRASLVRRGFLCLGPAEVLDGSAIQGAFEPTSTEGIFRRIY